VGRHLTFLPALALISGLILAGCTGDEDQVLPPVEPSDTSSRSTSPSTPGGGGDAPAVTPTGIALNNSQQAAFDQAVQDEAEWSRIGGKLEANPQPNQRTANIIRRYTFDPLSTQFFTSLLRYEKAGVHVEGPVEVVWRVPLDVNLDHPQRPKIVWKQCTDGSKLRVMHGREVIPQDPVDRRQVSRTTLYAANDGRWRVTRSERLEGSC
jgi:hypothetical protein